MTDTAGKQEPGIDSTRTTLVAVCTYNERKNLPDLIDAIFAASSDVDVLVVDDGSPDGTGQWVQSRRETDSRITLIQRGRKLGLGSAIVVAMQYAIDREYQYMINLDGDFSHDPARIPQMLETADRTGAGVVIGSRYIPGGKIEGWPASRKIMSAMLNRVARYALGLTPRDCSGAFRCYRVQTLRQIDFSTIRATGYALLEEMLWILNRQGVTMVEIPITFNNRTRGESKLSVREAARCLAMLLRISLQRRK